MTDAANKGPRLRIVPIEFDEATAFVRRVHRTHKPPRGYKFALAVSSGDEICGVVIVGRPVSRMLQDGFTLEVLRLATDGTKNACSCLYASAWRAARAMGYDRVVTYILKSEPGTSLKAAGWSEVYRSRNQSWNRKKRPRVDTAPQQEKIRFQRMERT